MNNLSAITGIGPAFEEKPVQPSDEKTELITQPQANTQETITNLNPTNEVLFQTPATEEIPVIKTETISPEDVPIPSLVDGMDKITSIAASEESEAINKFTAHGNQPNN